MLLIVYETLNIRLPLFYSVKWKRFVVSRCQM